jgi:hypothetical protein
MTHGPPPLARRRAEAALIRDPARSDALIAIEAACTPQAAWRWRADAERAGLIPHVPAAQRVTRQRTWPPTLTRKAIEAGAQTPQQIMALCPGVSYKTAWAALSRARSRPSAMDAAAATDSLRVTRRVMIHPVSAERAPAGYYQPADSIELACPACTLQWRDGGWVHERSCLLRGR